MSEVLIPPVISETPSLPRWRWAVHTGLLAAYVLGLGIAGAQIRDVSGDHAALPETLPELAQMCAIELLVFAIVFALAWMFSRARARELFLEWRGAWGPIVWGAIYSVGLRLAVMIVALILVIPFVAFNGKESVKGLRPKVENVIDTEAIKDPGYFVFTVSILSFVVAGLREELWRAGMIAGLAGMAPNMFSCRRGQFGAVVIAAIIFGLGHFVQGWGGVLMTGLLGLGLGSIIVWRRSIWEAALAHGFFDATSFAGIYVIAKYFPEALRDSGI